MEDIYWHGQETIEEVELKERLGRLAGRVWEAIDGEDPTAFNDAATSFDEVKYRLDSLAANRWPAAELFERSVSPKNTYEGQNESRPKLKVFPGRVLGPGVGSILVDTAPRARWKRYPYL